MPVFRKGSFPWHMKDHSRTLMFTFLKVIHNYEVVYITLLEKLSKASDRNLRITLSALNFLIIFFDVRLDSEFHIVSRV